MKRDLRAIVFDLDDTLYPYGAFVRSGFRAVARELGQEVGCSPSFLVAVLDRARRLRRGHELQSLCLRLRLAPSRVPALVRVVHDHIPTLRLPAESRRVLSSLRRGWRVGILTNGHPQVQRRKLQALGLSALVDAVVIASECGDGTGKPAPEGFRTVLNRLAVDPSNAVFVGDDLQADMNGAAAVGMHTVHVLMHAPRIGRRCRSGQCDAHVGSLRQVPSAADRLVISRAEKYVV